MAVVVERLLKRIQHETGMCRPAGAEALKLLETRGRSFIVFSDVVMPGMGGIALAETLARQRPDLRVVLASGYSTVLAERGGHDYELLHKPYSAEQLARTLQRGRLKAAAESAVVSVVKLSAKPRDVESPAPDSARLWHENRMRPPSFRRGGARARRDVWTGIFPNASIGGVMR